MRSRFSYSRLTTGHADLQLDEAVLQVELQRHQGQPALLEGRLQLLDFTPVDQQAPTVAGQLVVLLAGRLVARDVRADQPQLPSCLAPPRGRQ